MLETETKDLLKFNAEGYDPTYIWHTAKDKAVKAVNDYMVGKEEPMYCGFANVKIYNLVHSRSKFIKFLKHQEIGSSGYKGGWRISYYDIMPKSHQYSHTQSMDIKEIACEAFADALKVFGLEAYMESRAD